MDDRILARIARTAGVANLDELLEKLPPTDLQSLLLAVYARRAQSMPARAVLEQYERNRFVAPAEADPGRLLELDRLAFSLLPQGYERVELSPVAPLGTVAVLGGLSQDWAVATARNTEVVSDSTNVLALECASRRRQDRGTPVKLCASHRLLRGQHYGGEVRQHFRLLGLVAAGRGRTFGVEAIVEQLRFYRQLLAGVPDVRVALTPLDGSLAEEIAAAVDAELDETRDSGRDYYTSLCFKIYAGDTELADGGFTTWTQTLLGDRKELLVISGMGSERVAALL